MNHLSSELPKTLKEAYSFIKVIIPAYNAQDTLGEIVQRVRSLSSQLEVVVVDDGSKDATAEVARSSGAKVIVHGQNKGKGEALRTGFEYALRSGAAGVVTLDADGQHLPEEIPNLLRRWLATGASIVVGSRKREPGKMPLLRIITNTLSSWLVSLAAGTHIPDSQSGYRFLSTQVLRSLQTTSKGYAAESEILIKAAMRGFRIESAPISTIYSSEKSYIHPVKQPLLFLGLMFCSIFWRIRYLVTRFKANSNSFDK